MHLSRLSSLLVLATTLTVAQAPSVPLENQTDLSAHLSSDQKVTFESAIKLFAATRYTEALPIFRQLLIAFPADPVLSKYAAEAAIDSGQYPVAQQLLAPVLAANAADWQAHALRARLAAQQSDATIRDTEILLVAKLRDQGIVPKDLRQYIVERIPVGNHALLLFQSLFPWGSYKVYNYAQLFDTAGKLELRITLESSDLDQPLFAKQHPEAAAAGDRLFSYDGYRDQGTNNAGQRIEQHLTFSFAEKKPTYDEMRAQFLSIANGETKPSSSNTHSIP